MQYLSCKIIQEVTQNPSTASKELKSSLALAKGNVHDSTIWGKKIKTLGKLGFQGEIAWQKPVLTKTNRNARLKT